MSIVTSLSPGMNETGSPAKINGKIPTRWKLKVIAAWKRAVLFETGLHQHRF
jgi:hypothetical protein